MGKDKLTTIKAALLVQDMNVYPRHKVDNTHVSHIAEAILAGAAMPPVVASAKEKRISDGWHRTAAFLRVFGPDAEIPVILREYRDDAELFLDAVRMNSTHGHNITAVDRVRCFLMAKQLRIAESDVCAALHMRTERVGDLLVASTGTARAAVTEEGGTVALKNGMRHLAGKTLTKAQIQVNGNMNGNQVVYFVNRLIELIEANALDKTDERLVARLAVLKEKLAEVV